MGVPSMSTLVPLSDCHMPSPPGSTWLDRVRVSVYPKPFLRRGEESSCGGRPRKPLGEVRD